eukprot:GHVL01004531.1.p2 GENE.GHVL01004531.1~~GHVL01004531.1.p2  ORF type:complete len:145 (+),score=17.23 GHVL01004531.1:1406-1840(+)
MKICFLLIRILFDIEIVSMYTSRILFNSIPSLSANKRFHWELWVRPRISIYKSNRHIIAQLIDDDEQKTLVFVSTLQRRVQTILQEQNINQNTTVAAASVVGAELGNQGIVKGFKKVRFDRGGLPYHGKLKAIAEAARAAGLEF